MARLCLFLPLRLESTSIRSEVFKNYGSYHSEFLKSHIFKIYFTNLEIENPKDQYRLLTLETFSIIKEKRKNGEMNVSKRWYDLNIVGIRN